MHTPNVNALGYTNRDCGWLSCSALVARLLSLAPPRRFVTANPILRTSVAKSFKSLQSGFVASLSLSAECAPAPMLDEEVTALAEVTESSW